MKEKILEMLLASPGKPISGEEISRLLGISRAAIWKHIQALRAEGYEIESRTRQGYRLLQQPDLLTGQSIWPYLIADLRERIKIFHFHQLDSTNIYARKLATAGAPEGTVVIAESQWAGKGRKGRSWQSASGKGMWLTLVLRPPILPRQTTLLPLLTAVAVVEAVEKTVPGAACGIKWPNDVLAQNRKLAGILTEMSAELDMVNFVLVGVGVNLNQDEEDFAPDLLGTAISLKQLAGDKVNRGQFTAAFINAFWKLYERYLQEGAQAVLGPWRQKALVLGKEVIIHEYTGDWAGMALDIDEEGALLVRDEQQQIRRVLAGDVTLRLGEGQKNDTGF
ncbi:biotin--[acetyl-CoA-carboxylase] ligase [Carboxydocella sp. ULO1]|uniref:biotin--[acetyl-CoA-carboxylase] ligase n=1 Tax=Carboxydocella sp. ULO1 TaxID=1926599 RepID=UPI0009ADB196|nr:biotin--[acetyl-CoA-carboxylase] ligase [Carboxydocella sp. ULO1]GAW27487.1 bifunctional biotin--[acetyl-CoA-carboxylase] synthetase/biotin operon repressor [Carboxydocella sp. ULO1]